MREILFRGRSKVEGSEWLYGDVLLYADTAQIWESNDGRKFNYVVSRETVGQYIGLTDRNGKRIFEGDIVKHHRELWGKDDSVFGVVFWDAEKCRFCRTSSPCSENCYAESERAENQETPEMWASAAANYEVIGNVHDNPELLEGGAGNER